MGKMLQDHHTTIKDFWNKSCKECANSSGMVLKVPRDMNIQGCATKTQSSSISPTKP